jgi:hypothetical protein
MKTTDKVQRIIDIPINSWIIRRSVV